MQFNSYYFILFFLPISIIGYYLLNQVCLTAGLLYLLGMSLWFYGFFKAHFLILIIGSVFVNYWVSKIMERSKGRVKKSLLLFGIVFNVGIIFYFKYYNFFLHNVNLMFQTNFNLRNILLPLGISFFTFQQLSYIVDCYVGRVNLGGYTFIEYSLYVMFFPQLVAGPIVLHNELIPFFRDLSAKKINLKNFVNGIVLFVLGLSKKVLIADTLGKMVAWGFENTDIATSMDLILVMLAYTFQIYFDFSGYSDMAVGIGWLFNFRLPMNFNSPYQAHSIIDFWKRWHITLTRFLRTYIYYPLGGSKKGSIRTYIHIMIVFLVSGIWHGANYTFILWGLLHGIAQCINRFFKKQYDGWIPMIQWGITFIFLNFTWLLFRADDLQQWINMCKKIISFSNLQISSQLMEQALVPEFKCLYQCLGIEGLHNYMSKFSMWAFMIMCFWLTLKCSDNQETRLTARWNTLIIMPILFVWCLSSLSSISVFLYFNF